MAGISTKKNMYIPEKFAEEDFKRITALVESNPFGMLIIVDEGSPTISHLPFLFEPNIGSHGKLIGHMAKDNLQWKSLKEAKSVLVVFKGAHGYISPTLYSTPGVPTWNYAVVHLQGKPSVIEDPAGVENILNLLTTHFESSQPNPWKLSFPVEKSQLLQMIVGFEIDIKNIEAKFKLSQNKTAQEQQNIISELGKSNHIGDTYLSQFMATYFA